MFSEENPSISSLHPRGMLLPHIDADSPSPSEVFTSDTEHLNRSDKLKELDHSWKCCASMWEGGHLQTVPTEAQSVDVK